MIYSLSIQFQAKSYKYIAQKITEIEHHKHFLTLLKLYLLGCSEVKNVHFSLQAK